MAVLPTAGFGKSRIFQAFTAIIKDRKERDSL
jgi:hypothetical protein